MYHYVHDATTTQKRALTRWRVQCAKKKDDVSPQGLEPWSTGVITFTWKPDMITTYTTANPFGNGTTRVSSRVLRFFLGIKTYTVSLFRVFFSFLNFENFRSFFIALKSRAVALGSVRINAQLLRNVIIKTIRDDDEFKRFIISSS